MVCERTCMIIRMGEFIMFVKEVTVQNQVGLHDIKIIADGSDEQVAVNSLVELVESGFSD